MAHSDANASEFDHCRDPEPSLSYRVAIRLKYLSLLKKRSTRGLALNAGTNLSEN